jgi:hypothetical protein
MNQALYAHMNKKKKKRNIQECPKQTGCMWALYPAGVVCMVPKSQLTQRRKDSVLYGQLGTQVSAVVL